MFGFEVGVLTDAYVGVVDGGGSLFEQKAAVKEIPGYKFHRSSEVLERIASYVVNIAENL